MEVLLVFRFCDAFGTLPRAGGAEDQEPETMTTMLMLKQIKDRAEAGERAEHEAELLSLLRTRRG